MGICQSTKKNYNQQINNNQNPQSNQQKNQQIQINNQNSLLTYPKGKSLLLKKIQGLKISNDNLKNRIELYINILKVPKPDTYSIDVFITEKGNTYKIASLNQQRTDVNNQIHFSDYVEMDYFFERDQAIEFSIKSSSTKTIIKDKVAKIAGMSKRGYQSESNGVLIEVQIIPIKSETKVIVFDYEIITSNKENATVAEGSIFKGKEIYYLLKNYNDNKKWRGVYKSEESKTCKFDSVNISEDDLFLGDNEKKFKFDLVQSNESYSLASSEFSISDILSKEGIVPIDIFNSNGEIDNRYSGMYYIGVKIKTVERLTFTQLLKKGLQISLIVGIDFTGSNGNPSSPSSLHYINGSTPNSYEKSIRSCGNILSYYDTDNMYPLFGFGGVPLGKSYVDHSFPLNFSSNPCVQGIDEMINVYKHAITVCQLNGPTNFSPLISTVCKFVSSQGEGNYFILMIITDGEICDIDDTKNIIVSASLLPLSIIIIGVGSSSFEAMNLLDGDDLPLRNSQGKLIERDIVQFVPFSKYENDPQMLSEEVLKELPDQIELYYRNKQFFKN